MPKRSNTVQRLIAAVHADIGDGWDVKESVYLTNSVTRKPREVDIVAKYTIGPYPLILAIECRDHRRPADVSWIEAMATKHEYLPTSKLVLWSCSGFYKDAITTAKALKIEVMQGDATNANWAELARALLRSRLKYVAPQFNAFVDVETDDGRAVRYEPCEGLSFGDESASSEILIGTWLLEKYEMSEIQTVVLDHAQDGKGSFYIECKFPHPVHVWDGNRRIGLLLRIGIGLQTTTETSPLEVRSVLHRDAVHTVATANISIGEMDFIIKEKPGMPPSIRTKIIKKKNGG